MAIKTEGEELGKGKALFDTLSLKTEEIEHMSKDIEKSRRESQDLSHQLEQANTENGGIESQGQGSAPS